MNEEPSPTKIDCPPSAGRRSGAAPHSSRVAAMIRFLESNRDRIEGINKGQLVLHFGGNSVVPELVEKFEPVN